MIAVVVAVAAAELQCEHLERPELRRLWASADVLEEAAADRLE